MVDFDVELYSLLSNYDVFYIDTFDYLNTLFLKGIFQHHGLSLLV